MHVNALDFLENGFIAGCEYAEVSAPSFTISISQNIEDDDF